MNTYRRRAFLESTFFVAVLLSVLSGRAYAIHVTTYHYVGTVGPTVTQLCDITGGTFSSAYEYEANAQSMTSSSGGELCVTLAKGTTLTGDFYILYNDPSGVASYIFYGTAATANVVGQPKYAIVGMFYAPPCSSGKSASSVVYGSSNQLKVDNSLTNEFTQSESVALSGSVALGDIPITIGSTLTYGWSAGTTTGTDVAVTTSSSESYTIDGCLGVDGINHIYDIIWVWLDPVVPYYLPTSTSSDIFVLGIGSDPRDPVSHQTSAPDVVALSVTQIQKLIAVLNADQTPTPTNTGISASTLQELQRTWDTTWVTNSGGEPGPGLVAADYEDILNADPFVANPSFNPASSTRYAEVKNVVVYYDATATPTETSYTGQAIDAASQTSGTDDQHYVSVEVSVTIGAAPDDGKLDTTGKWLWDTKSQATTTNTSTQTATFNIWDPAASYTGPDTLSVYWDTVYQSFVFYPL
jgi:hypothetical protein